MLKTVFLDSGMSLTIAGPAMVVSGPPVHANAKDYDPENDPQVMALRVYLAARGVSVAFSQEPRIDPPPDPSRVPPIERHFPPPAGVAGKSGNVV